MKRIIVNADDLGMHPAVDEAIVQLAGRRVVSSASLMALGSPSAATLAALKTNAVDLGLHLDFTSDLARAHGCGRSLPALIAACWLRRLDRQTAAAMIDAQLDRFEALAGGPPRFIDGHQHVHQFPVIREALLAALSRRYPGKRFFFRHAAPGGNSGFKAAVIGALGAAKAKRSFEEAGWTGNADFFGVYDFSPELDLERAWSSWLERAAQGGALFMCHPAARVAPELDHPAAREREFSWLKSEDFARLCARHGVEICGWERALA